MNYNRSWLIVKIVGAIVVVIIITAVTASFLTNTDRRERQERRAEDEAYQEYLDIHGSDQAVARVGDMLTFTGDTTFEVELVDVVPGGILKFRFRASPEEPWGTAELPVLHKLQGSRLFGPLTLLSPDGTASFVSLTIHILDVDVDTREITYSRRVDESGAS